MTDPKLITEYLIASGVTAICIVKEPKGYGYAVGRATVTMANMVAAFWIEKPLAAKVVRLARSFAGDAGILASHLDRSNTERALQRAASSFYARLTPNNIVISRATDAANRLESYLVTMQASGGLAAFNTAYKQRRKNAGARGEKFMSFGVANTRLRRALIKLLVAKQQLRVGVGVFDDVFSGRRL